jgi:uroporphyrinogen-III synthase
MHLLVTRPEPQGEQTAQALRARGHEVTLAPLLRVEPLAANLGNGLWSAVAMTSANAVGALERQSWCSEILPLRLFTVGARTADAAREAGFADAISADGDAHALADTIAENLPDGGKLLYLAGVDRSRELSRLLAGTGIAVETVEIYRAVPETVLPPGAVEALRAGTIDGVLHFSKRSAQTFLAAATAGGILRNSLNCQHFCLSSQVAEAFGAVPGAKLRIATRPDEAALLDLVGRD